MAFEYDIVQTLASIGESSAREKRLSLVSWNGRPATLDLRCWVKDPDRPGELKPGKGITLNDTEAQMLADALLSYLDG